MVRWGRRVRRRLVEQEAARRQEALVHAVRHAVDAVLQVVVVLARQVVRLHRLQVRRVQHVLGRAVHAVADAVADTVAQLHQRVLGLARPPLVLHRCKQQRP